MTTKVLVKDTYIKSLFGYVFVGGERPFIGMKIKNAQ